MTILIDKEKLIHDLIQILHDDVCAPNGHLDPYYVFKVIKEQPSAQSEPCDDPRADIYYLAEKIGIHRLYALVVELRGEPEPCEDAVSRQAAIGECNKRGAEHIGYAIAHLPSAQPERWIPTSERMPIARRSVIISTKNWTGEGCYWETTEHHVIWKGYRWNATYWDDEVMAWMPLPEPYTERREE